MIYLVAVNEQTLKHSDIFPISSLVKISITCMTFSIYTFFASDYTDNKKNITRWREDMTFIFSCYKQYFTHSLCSFVKYCFHHSKIKVISSRRRNFFPRRQSDSSLIVGHIIDSRPGLRALSMDPFVTLRNPLVHHISITSRCSSSTTCREVNDLLRDAIANLITCFSGSENTQ